MTLQIVFCNTVREQQDCTDPCDIIVTLRVLTCGLKSAELLSRIEGGDCVVQY